MPKKIKKQPYRESYSYISGNGNPKKSPYISGNGNAKKLFKLKKIKKINTEKAVVIFQETETLKGFTVLKKKSNPRKFIVFQEMELYSPKTKKIQEGTSELKTFFYILRNGTSKIHDLKISYISRRTV